MAVIECTEFYDGRGGREDENGIKTATRTFTVLTDDIRDSEFVVLAGLRYPAPPTPLGPDPIQKYDPHPHDRSCILRDANAQPTGPTSWRVVLNYSNAPFPAPQQGTGATALAGPSAPITPSGNPSTGNNLSKPAPDRIPTWSYSVKTVEVPGEFYYDSTNSNTKTPYVNKIGDPIEGLTVERYNLMMSVQYFSFEMTDTKIADRIGKVNITTYRGFPPGGMIVRDIKREDVYDFIGYDGGGDEVFGLVWKVSIELEAVNATDFWQTKVLHTGRRGRTTTGGPIITFVDRFGERVADPLPLDLNGVCLRDPALASPTVISPSEFKYITYYDRESFDFDNLIV